MTRSRAPEALHRLRQAGERPQPAAHRDAEPGKASGKDPAFAELTRRLGFEYNGMILHEYYCLEPPSGREPARPPAPGSARRWPRRSARSTRGRARILPGDGRMPASASCHPLPGPRHRRGGRPLGLPAPTCATLQAAVYGRSGARVHATTSATGQGQVRLEPFFPQRWTGRRCERPPADGVPQVVPAATRPRPR